MLTEFLYNTTIIATLSHNHFNYFKYIKFMYFNYSEVPQVC